MIPLSKLKLTERRQKALEAGGIMDVETLLKTYPSGYDNNEVKPYSEWKIGENVCFEGVICSEPVVKFIGKNRSITTFKVLSWNQELQISIFNMPYRSSFPFGKKLSFFGLYKGKNQVTLMKFTVKPLTEFAGLQPRYNQIPSLKPKDWKAIMAKALKFADQIPDYVPQRLRKKYRLIDKAKALEQIHNPIGPKWLQQAIRSLKYEEFLCFQCVLQQNYSLPPLKTPRLFDPHALKEQIEKLPYELTADQKKVLEEILEDLRSERSMYRLLQGDVGCGKTIVAAMALYAQNLAGYQAALLAPTELLATQHYENLKNLGLQPTLLVASLPAATKRKTLEEISQGQARLVVGTHALLQERVEFENLGLVITDEQHRFGVRQRRSLVQKGENPDFLMMSATPIPRTYAHFLFGDVSLSSIKTLPPGRKPVETHFVAGSSMKPFLSELLEGIRQGRQCYVVCAAIEENEEYPLKAAQKIYAGMKKTLKDVHIGLLHGKMKTSQKQEIMQDFLDKKINVLVSTTVIEVGIDVPNATMMVIYDSHRFGLATLHQLRGRVARGKEQGICWMLSDTKDNNAKKRLKMLEKTRDGFELAKYDLENRGPGDLLGLRQSGLPGFLLGDFIHDPAMMECCIEDAREILDLHQDSLMLEYIDQANEKSQYID